MAKQAEIPENLVLPAEGFIRIKHLVRFVPLSRTTIWRKTKEGKFPQPVRISAYISAWRVADVREWIAQAERGEAR